MSYLTKGLSFKLTHYDENEKILSTQSYCAKNGLLDLIKDNVESPVHSTPLYYESTEGDLKVEVAAQWTRKKERSFTFTNGLINVEGGTSLTGAKESLTRNINKLFKSEYTGDMARTGLVYAVSCRIPNPSFANQTKTKINNPELRGAAGRAITEALSQFSLGAPNELKQIQDFLAKEQKAETAAQKARDAIINHQKEMSESSKKKVILVNKLKDAQYLGENSTLLICEGDSALTSLLQGRDVDKYGIIPIRGKILNCLSNSMEDILENEEVKSIFMAIGLTIGKPYDPKKLRYGRVGIAVDADDDGSHIACLIMALFEALCPQFLIENRLYWLRAPLFIVSQKGKNSYYFSNSEMPSGLKGEITRCKGLGQMDAKDVEESMFGSAQRLEQIIPTPEGRKVLRELMGEDVQPRKNFVFSRIDFSTLTV